MAKEPGCGYFIVGGAGNLSEIYEGRRSLRLIKTALRQTRLRIKAPLLSNRIKEDSERPAQVVSRSLEGRQAQFSMKKRHL